MSNMGAAAAAAAGGSPHCHPTFEVSAEPCSFTALTLMMIQSLHKVNYHLPLFQPLSDRKAGRSMELISAFITSESFI